MKAERSIIKNAAPMRSELEKIGMSSRDAEAVLRMIRSANSEDEVDAVLDAANEAMNAHGVEALHETEAYVDRYYQDIIGLYVNVGDSYKGTLLFDTAEFEFLVTSWGDFYEAWEKKRFDEKVEEVDRDVIVESMARAFFVSNWADRKEEQGETFPGEELMDIAPETSPAAEEHAKRFAKAVEELNHNKLEVLYVRAATADGKHDEDPTPEDFGHYLAMQGLGHGVAWTDDHPDVGILVPRTEFYEEIDEEENGSGDLRGSSGSDKGPVYDGVPNLDALSADELMKFWLRYRKGVKRNEAERLFGGRHPGFTNTAGDLANYAFNKATAVRLREKGDISTALMYEGIADKIYDRLPNYARW